MEIAWLDRVEIWPHIAAHLRRLCMHEHMHGMTYEGLRDRISTGKYRVWILGDDIDAVFLTAMYPQQNGRMMVSLSWAVGDNAIHPDVVLPVIEHYARMHNCHGIEVMGRKGWERVLKPHGFGPFYTGLVKEL